MLNLKNFQPRCHKSERFPVLASDDRRMKKTQFEIPGRIFEIEVNK